MGMRTSSLHGIVTKLRELNPYPRNAKATISPAIGPLVCYNLVVFCFVFKFSLHFLDVFARNTGNYVLVQMFGFRACL